MDTVSVQFALLDKLWRQQRGITWFRRCGIERKMGFARTNFASSRGQSLGKVTVAKAFIGGAVLVTIWHLLTYTTWRHRRRYYRGQRGDDYRYR